MSVSHEEWISEAHCTTCRLLKRLDTFSFGYLNCSEPLPGAKLISALLGWIGVSRFFFFFRWFYWSDTLLGSSAGLRVSLNSWQLTRYMYTPGLSDLVSLVSFRDFLKPLYSLLPKGSKLLWGIECFHFLINILLLKSFSSRWRFYFRENLYKTSPLLCSLQLTSPRHSTMSLSLIISCPLFVFLSQWVWLCTWL